MNTPAFEQNRSIGPISASVSSTTRTTSDPRVTSAVIAVPPTSAAIRRAPSPSISTTTTWRAPSAVNREASARPIPLAPRVTTAMESLIRIQSLDGATPRTPRGSGAAG